jgi:hypothetical protein
MAKTVTPTSES